MAREASAIEVSVREVSAREASAREASAREASAREASAREMSNCRGVSQKKVDTSSHLNGILKPYGVRLARPRSYLDFEK